MNNIPAFPEKLLKWFLRDELAEEVLGDLEEEFQDNVQKKSLFKARIIFWYQVLNYLRPFAIKNFKFINTFFIMTNHNLTIAYRSLLRYKSSFLINLVGLSSGIACAILIFLWVSSELKMDKFHENDEQLYQVYLNHFTDNGIQTIPSTPGPLATALENEVPEVQSTVKDTDANWFGDGFTIGFKDEWIKAKGKFSGPEYFELFSYKLKHGDRSTLLNDRKSIVISESMAEKIFGTTEGVIGKTVEWGILDFTYTAEITGIFEDLPSEASEDYEFILPYIHYEELVGNANTWGSYNVTTYALLEENVDVSALNQKIASFIKTKDEGSIIEPFFKKYSSKYLYGSFKNGQESGGRIIYVQLFSIIALFILVIACINFMNLSTARASRRMKEIGIKKTLGARRGQLVVQHLSEAILIAALGTVVACFLAYFILPYFNFISGKNIAIQFNKEIVLGLLSLTIFTGLISGSYPALYLSGFNAISIFKNKLNSSTGEAWTRKGLVVFQFVLSIILVVSVIVVYKQIEMIQSKNLGYDRTNVVSFTIEGNVANKLDVFLEQVRQLPGVKNASATSHAIVANSNFTTGISWPGKNPDETVQFEQGVIYFDFMETMGIEMIEGKAFGKGQDNSSKLVLNESAIAAMGLEDPIGKKIDMWGRQKEIAGVFKDFHYSSLHNDIGPMVFYFDPSANLKVVVKIENDNLKENLAALSDFYTDFNEGYTLNYSFLDENYQQQYITEQRVSSLSRYFAGLAILISCLGLFGLAAFTAERRQKEIGVRKILGARSFEIVKLMATEFTRIVFVAIIIALPLSYFLAEEWLSSFAYRIDVAWWYFALAGAIALLITWITVGIQTLKAALANPLHYLKDE